MTANTPASRKAKGRRLQQAVAQMIVDRYPELEPDDVRSAIMGESGEDVKLSPAARRLFPFATECKAHERLNIYAAWKQAKANSGAYIPLIVHKKNHSEILCTLRFSDLLSLMSHPSTESGQ